MNRQTTRDDDEMPAEIDFAGGKCGQFHAAHAQLKLPVYLEQQVQATLAALAALAAAKGVDFSALVNDLLKKDIELIEMARQPGAPAVRSRRRPATPPRSLAVSASAIGRCASLAIWM